MFATSQFARYTRVIALLLACLLLLSACTTADPTVTMVAPAATAAPDPTEAPAATDVPAATDAPAPTEAPATGAPDISLDTTGIASGFQRETIPARPDDGNSPYWDVLPEYTVLTLEGYPISNHLMQPQIFIYPLPALGEVNEAAGTTAGTLQSLIQSPQELPTMPFMPIYNAAQVMHTHLQYLDFATGQGLRYLTEYDQAFIPINNYELIYTYQGLTADGKYYVAAVLPVTHPSLPADAMVTGNEPAEFTEDFPAYLANVSAALNVEAGNRFTPDLTQLDAMMSSLAVR